MRPPPRLTLAPPDCGRHPRSYWPLGGKAPPPPPLKAPHRWARTPTVAAGRTTCRRPEHDGLRRAQGAADDAPVMRLAR
ncbi:hypothetical protein HNY73_008873 [Argiope bruennichi]|uniref:Uncharacterized protein n=1 Tax=Argiope bruennichi TaxID=94029 RepID=A0A8T0F7S1_ARGBR|nr:hypothetical protein HNY73_008873 [Argiope bruennichi]